MRPIIWWCVGPPGAQWKINLEKVVYLKQTAEGAEIGYEGGGTFKLTGPGLWDQIAKFTDPAK